MPNLEQMALAAARAFNPKLAEQAEKELNNFTRDKDGLQKVVAKYGGMAFIDQAANFANSAPKVKAMFKKFGVNPMALKETVVKELQVDKNTINVERKNPDIASTSRERLNKLR